MNNPVRRDYANESMIKSLFGSEGATISQERPAFRDDAERLKSEIFRSYFSLLNIFYAIEQTQYYFRRYPFSDMPISKSDHLVTVCELYFDRIGRFRDRVKNLTKLLKQARGEPDERYGRLVRWLNDNLDGELRNRNFIQHHGRFECFSAERLKLMELLSINDRSAFKETQRDLYRNETQKWAARCVSTHKALNHIVDICASFVLELDVVNGRVEADPGREGAE